MDHDEEFQKFKWILFAGVAFVVSAFVSWKELRFAVWSATAEATVTGTFEVRGGRRSSPKTAVEYTFTDEVGTQRSERDDIPISWPAPLDVVIVQYFPGVEDSSRIKGNSNPVAVVFFVCCSGWLGFSLFKLYREAQDPHPYRRGRR